MLVTASPFPFFVIPFLGEQRCEYKKLKFVAQTLTKNVKILIDIVLSNLLSCLVLKRLKLRT